MINVDLSKIPEYNDFSIITPIEKGSGENKYHVVHANGSMLFLRVGYMTNYESVQISLTAETLGIPMAKTLYHGILNGGEYFYSLQTWIDGTDAIALIPTLDENKKFEFGVKAGKLLSKLHTLPASQNIKTLNDWLNILTNENRINKVLDNNPNDLILCENIIAYIKNNKYILNLRPQTFNHGDWGIANLLITLENEVLPFDFSVNQYHVSNGDPWFEIENYKLRTDLMSYQAGEIYGYFNGEIPNEFWQVYLFYEMLRAFRYLLEMPELTPRLHEWYNNRIESAESIIPYWYKKR